MGDGAVAQRVSAVPTPGSYSASAKRELACGRDVWPDRNAGDRLYIYLVHATQILGATAQDDESAVMNPEKGLVDGAARVVCDTAIANPVQLAKSLERLRNPGSRWRERREQPRKPPE